jgi:transcriptional regulator with GAF, ATPase, and Fis domain
VNCAALPAELLASEWFGHEPGAFTGALERRRGLLAAADGGTVFLDEIGDLSLQGQAMLLRFLKEREIRPVGSPLTLPLDVRVLAATNRDLEAEVAGQQFRADLYDRLCEVLLAVPPLRDRREDIPVLVEWFLVAQAARHGRRAPAVGSTAWRVLSSHGWPGNVRELERVVSRAVIFAENGYVRAADLMLDGALDEYLKPTTAAAGDPAGLSIRQREALRIVRDCGAIRSADLVRRFGVSREAARRDLVALVAEPGFWSGRGQGEARRTFLGGFEDRQPA